MPQRILFVNTPAYIGGAEISLLTLMQHLSADRYEPLLLTSNDGPLLERVREIGIPIAIQKFSWFSKRRPWQYLLSTYQLARLIQDKGINLVHTNCDHSLRYVMYASRLAGVPYVSHVRDFVRTWFEPDKVVALNRAAHVIANSNAIARACIQAGIELGRVMTIYNPVDTENFWTISSAVGTQLRAELGISSEAIVVGIVGQIQSIKGHEEFLMAGFQLAAKISGIHFLIVGSAPPDNSGQLFLRKLQTQITKSGHAPQFHLLGFRNDIPAVMKAIDILAIPSWSEPFGRVAVEGMAAGCSVVGTDAGGLPEIITDEVNGLLIPPKDTNALYDALHRLSVNSELRQQFAHIGCCTSQRFTIADHVEKVQTLYDAVLSAHGSSPPLVNRSDNDRFV